MSTSTSTPTAPINNIKNLAYNILKTFKDGIIKGKKITELGPCSECDNDILISPLKAFMALSCGHVFHRICIKKKLLLTVPNTCPSPGCGDNVEILDQADALGFLRFSSQPQAPLKPLIYLTCNHVIHYNCIDNPQKLCPICPSTDMEIDDGVIVTNSQESSTAQKKCSSGSTKKSFNKKAKKVGGKKVSSMIKQLIEELLTDIPSAGGRSLEEASESVSNFLQLSERIDHAETKNEEASWGFIFSYFNFGEAVFKRYKELKPKLGKDGSKAVVKKEVRLAIPETKCSDEALQKRTERSKKIYKLFNSIGKEKIAQIRSISPSFILNLTADETKYVMAEILTHKV
ncbi:hypothetical protein F8M41_007713 [Gigaspora margarita]|uniref:RING-type domain-containing protein n=1 Tax=Gigaspora margarita TaxID=4874 RepID=A0A8H4A539_GIGMA|nr:hypothetical protein F8M41_007713 [Gigaspora margarita]